MKEPSAAQRFLAIGSLAVLVALAGAAYQSMARREVTAPAAPAVDAGRPERAGGWTPAPEALASAVDLAFASGAAIATDGKRAVFDPGDGVFRPIEVAVAIPRVFAAAGRLFAAGENEGAPFLILLERNEEPKVMPMPCAVASLEGEGSALAGACANGAGIAVSTDGARTFKIVPIAVPAPKEAEGLDVERSLEAVSINGAGSLAVALAQRWRVERGADALLWSLGQVATRASGKASFAAATVPALARAVGLQHVGNGVVLAGLEVALAGRAEGEARARLFRGGAGEPPLPVGNPGPVCGSLAQAGSVEGVMLSPGIAAFRCGSELALTLDGGATWQVERGLGSIEMLRAGDMRLFVRAGGKAWERRFIDRSESGAFAVRVPPADRDAGVRSPAAALPEIKEPDAGP